jgi:hypothetical protein
MTKTESRKSRDTVPLKLILVFRKGPLYLKDLASSRLKICMRDPEVRLVL